MTDISRTDGGPVTVEYTDGTKEHITNTGNIMVRGKAVSARNTDFTDDALIRISEGARPALYEFKLSELTVSGVAPANLQAAVDDIAELFQNVVV